FGCVRIRDRHLEERHLVRLRVEDRYLVARVLSRTVEGTVGIDGRIAPVRRDQVVGKLLLRAPLPRRDDDVALDALRPRRLALRQLALGDAVGPIAEILERHAAELSGKPVHHDLAGLSGRNAAHPCLRAGLEVAELRRDGARRFLPELMAANAIDVTHALAPGLARDVLRDLGRAAEILLRRN